MIYQKNVIPSPCKQDCPNRCFGCKVSCKKYEIYEKITNQLNSKYKIGIEMNKKQDEFIREYNGYRFLKNGIVKGIVVQNLKLQDTGTKIRVNLSDNGVQRIYSLDKVIYKIFTGKHDFIDTKIKIIHKDGNYKNCSFDNLDCELV